MIFKSDFLSFSPHNLSKFFSYNLSFPLLYQSYRVLCCESVLGDQSVEITKVFNLVFEEANLRVCIVSSSCGSSVWRCGLGKQVCLRVFVLAGTSEGTSESKSYSVNSL